VHAAVRAVDDPDFFATPFTFSGISTAVYSQVGMRFTNRKFLAASKTRMPTPPKPMSLVRPGTAA